MPLIKIIALLMQGYRCLKQGQTSACFALVAEGGAALDRWMGNPAEAERNAPAVQLRELDIVAGEPVEDDEVYFWERDECH